MGKPNRKCICCGEAYEYCGSCREAVSLPTWKNLFDTENCKNIFYTVTDYLAGELSEDIAKMQFEDCDLSRKDMFTPKIQDTIQKIMGTEAQAQESTTKAVRTRKITKKD